MEGHLVLELCGLIIDLNLVSNERKSSVSPNSKIVGKSKVNNESKMARIFPQEGIREEDDELKTLLAKSEKLTMLDPKRVDFQNKLSNYLTHKK